MIRRTSGLSLSVLLLCGIFYAVGGVSAASAADDLTPAVAKPLEAAEKALAAHQYGPAMDAVKNADAVSGKTSYDSYVIEQMRGAVAAQSGDLATMGSSYDRLIDSPRTTRAQKAQMIQAEATAAYTAKDYPRAVTGFERYLKAIGLDADIEKYLIQAYYLQKDYANAGRIQKQLVDETLRAGKKPAENDLLMLAACATQTKDSSAQMHAYTLLATYYPKPDYWAQLLHSLVTNSRIPPALQMDVYRVRLAVGNLEKASDYVDAAEIATQSGLPRIGLEFLSQGYTSGVLGKGPGADREARLRSFISAAAEKKRASFAGDEEAAQREKTGGQLLTAGYNYVTFGEAEKGLSLMRQALSMPLPDVNIARLRLGEAQMDAGQDAAAIKTFRTVEGDNGARDIAQLWVLKLSGAVRK